MSAGADTLGSGDKPYSLRVGNLYAAATINSANGTTPVTLITGAPGYYITDLGLQVSANATVSGGNVVSFNFTDDQSGMIASFLWWLPGTAASPANPTNNRVVTGPSNLIWSSKVAASNLQIASTVALTNGSVRFFVRYGLTSILG